MTISREEVGPEVADWDEDNPGYNALVCYWESVGADPDEARETARKLYPKPLALQH